MNREELFIDYDNLPYALTDDETNNLIYKIKAGDIDARNILIEHNIRLVVYVVSKKFWNIDYDKEELVSIGSIGLIKAANTFDVNKKIKFSTYAARCIINEILMFLKNEKKNITGESLNTPVYRNSDSDELKLESILSSDVDLEEEYTNKESQELIKSLVEELPSREREIIMLRFGFYDGRKHTNREIGEKFNVTGSNISGITINVLKKLKKQYVRKYN